MSTEQPSPPSLWTSALAWSAAYAGVPIEHLSSGLDPHASGAMSSRLASIPSGDGRARADALFRARAQWLRGAVGDRDTAARVTLGARVIASIVACTPASARPAVARSFDPDSLRAAALEARCARTCDALALGASLEALARTSAAPPTATLVGALALAVIDSDSDAPSVIHGTLRALRARGASPCRAFAPFAADARALFPREPAR